MKQRRKGWGTLEHLCLVLMPSEPKRKPAPLTIAERVAYAGTAIPAS
jgi:hypothetical protein